MNCPRDGSGLVDARVNGCVLKLCPQCEGVWLERGVLEGILDLHHSALEQRISRIGHARTTDHCAPEKYMRCPRCRDGRLQQITVTYRKMISVDRCEQCLGLWLDRTELDAVVADKKYVDTYDREAAAALRARLRAADPALSRSAGEGNEN